MATESKEIVEQPRETEAEKADNLIAFRIVPRHFWSADAEHDEWRLEVELPGVPKSAVHFKYLTEAFELRAQRDDVLFSLTEYFPFEIDTNSVKAKYGEGLLVVTGKVRDPMSEAKEIPLQ